MNPFIHILPHCGKRIAAALCAAIILHLLPGQVNGQSSVVLGTGTGSNSPWIYPAPFGNTQASARHQFLVTADELRDAGLAPGALIISLGFHVLSTNTLPLEAWQMTAYTTNEEDPLALTWHTGDPAGTTVPGIHLPTPGWNMFELTNPFTWNGEEHLVIATCFANSAGSSNALTQWETGAGPQIRSRWFRWNDGPACDAALSTGAVTTRPNIKVGWAPYSPCIVTPATPIPGLLPPNACASDTLHFTLVAPVAIGEGSYQWQRSDSPVGPWTAIGTAGPNTDAVLGTAGWFRCEVSCDGSGWSGTTEPVFVDLATTPCQCLPYPASMGGTQPTHDIVLVNIAGTEFTSVCGGTAPGYLSIPGRYSDHTTWGSSFMLEAGQEVPYTIGINGCGGAWNIGNAIVAIFIDLDQDGSFTGAGERLATKLFSSTVLTASGTFTIPTNAHIGTTRLRVVYRIRTGLGPVDPHLMHWSPGETEDFCLEITTPPCTGTPATGSTIASKRTLCSDDLQAVQLSLAQPGESMNGWAFQWQSAPDLAGPWTDLGLTAPTVTVEPVISTWYQCITTCTHSGESSVSDPVRVLVDDGACICRDYQLPIQTNNQSWMQIVSVEIAGTAMESDCNGADPGTATIPGFFGDHTVDWPPVELAAGSTVPFSIQVGACGSNFGNLRAAVFVDWDQDGLFTGPGERVHTHPQGYGPHLIQGTITVPIDALPGSTRLRVVLEIHGGWNEIQPVTTIQNSETEDHCIRVVVPTCSALAGTWATESSHAIICPNAPFILSLAGPSPVPDLNYQWQWAPAVDGPWNDLGDDHHTLTTTLVEHTWYRCLITCQADGTNLTSEPVPVEMIEEDCLCPLYPPAIGTTGNNRILSVTVGNMTNLSMLTEHTAAMGPGSIPYAYGNYVGMIDPVEVSPGEVIPVSILTEACRSVMVLVDWDRDGSFDGPGETAMADAVMCSGLTPLNHVFNGSFTVPIDAVAGIMRMRVAGFDANGNLMEAEDYCLMVLPEQTCTGFDWPTNITAPQTMVCPEEDAILSLEPLPFPSGGITYSWQTAPGPNGPWTNTAHTTHTINEQVMDTTWFRSILNCPAAGSSFVTEAIRIIPVDDPCRCATEGDWSNVSYNGAQLLHVSIGSLSNSSIACELAPGPGSVRGRYANYSRTTEAPVFLPGEVVPISLQRTAMSGTPGTHSRHVYVDWNMDGQFDAGETVLSGNFSSVTLNSSFTIPVDALPGTRRILIGYVHSSTGMAGSGTEFENYCITVLPAPICDLPPDPGNTLLNMAACPSLSLQYTDLPHSGIIRQWQWAPSSSGPWTYFGDSLTTQELLPGTGPWYRGELSCTATGAANPSTPVFASMDCSCTQYPASGAENASGGPDILAFELGGETWTSGCYASAPGFGSQGGRYSNFTGLADGPVVTQGSMVPLSITSGSCPVGPGQNITPTAAQHAVYIDWDQNGDFDGPDELVFLSAPGLTPQTATGYVNVPLNALPGQTRLRVIVMRTLDGWTVPMPTGTYERGETEDYCLTVLPASTCDQLLDAGETWIFPPAPYIGQAAEIGLLNTAGIDGSTFQWQVAPDDQGPWENIGTNVAFLTVYPQAALWYRCVLTCTASGASATSIPALLEPVDDPCNSTPYPFSSATAGSTRNIIQVTFGDLDNSSACGELAPGPGSSAGRYSNYTGAVPPVLLQPGNVVDLSVVAVHCVSAQNLLFTVGIHIDLDQDGAFTSPGELVLQSIPGTLPMTVSGTFTVPLTALPGTTRLRVVLNNLTTNDQGQGLYGQGETEDYCVVVLPGSPCNASLDIGTTYTSDATPCPGGSITLWTDGPDQPTNDLLHQWQQAASENGPWMNVGNNWHTHGASPNSSTWYRCLVTCQITGTVHESIPVHVAPQFMACTCAPYPPSASSSPVGSDIVQVQIGSLTHASTCGDLAAGSGSLPHRYSNHCGTYDAPEVWALMQVPLSISIDLCNASATSSMVAVFVDWDQDGAFTGAGERVFESILPAGTTTVAGNFMVPSDALLGQTRVRVVHRVGTNLSSLTPAMMGGIGETEDHCIAIIAPSPCSTIPPFEVQAAFPPLVCVGATIELFTADTFPSAAGYSLDWQQAPAQDGPWSSFASNAHAITTELLSDTWYRLVVVCNAIGDPDTSNVLAVSLTDLCQCNTYPNSSANGTSGTDITSVTVGSMSNSSACNVLAPGAGSIAGRYSNFTGSVVPPDVLRGELVPFNVQIATCQGDLASRVGVFVDWNQDGHFTGAGERVHDGPPMYGEHMASGFIQVPYTAALGTTRLRIVNRNGASSISSGGTYPSGETEDYCFNVITAPCLGVPDAGQAMAQPTHVGPGGTTELSLAGHLWIDGLSYAWQFSEDTLGTWTPVGGNSPYITVSPTVSAWYRCEVSCMNSGLAAYSEAVEVTILPGGCLNWPYTLSGLSNASISIQGILSVAVGDVVNQSDWETPAPGPGSLLNRYSNFTMSVGGMAAVPGQVVPFSVLVDMLPGYTSRLVRLAVYADWDQNGTLTGPGELLYISPARPTPHVFSDAFVVPAGALPGHVRLRFLSLNSTGTVDPHQMPVGEVEDHCFEVLDPGPCSGIPVPGQTIVPSGQLHCPGSTVTLALTGMADLGGDVLFEWRSAEQEQGPWSIMAGSGPSLTVVSEGPQWYQCVVTCPSSGASAASDPVYVQPADDPCRCLTYQSPATTNGSYSFPQLQSITLNGTIPSASQYGPSDQPPSINNIFTNNTHFNDLPPMEPGDVVPITIQLASNSAHNATIRTVAVFIDWDRDGDMNGPDERVLVGSILPFSLQLQGQITVPNWVEPGTVRMRVRVSSLADPMSIMPVMDPSFGTSQDLCITIEPASPCNGTPPGANTLSNTEVVCPNGTVHLSLSTVYSGVSGITYQWQQAVSSNGPWTGMGTNTAATSATLVQDTWFRCIIRCSNDSTTSTPILLMTDDAPCTCDEYPISQAMGTASFSISSVQIGPFSNASDCGTIAPGPGSLPNRYSNFRTLGASAVVNTGDTVSIQITRFNCDSQNQRMTVGVFVDWDQDGNLYDLGELVYQAPFPNGVDTIQGQFIVPANALPGPTMVRVVMSTLDAWQEMMPYGVYYRGETEDYCIIVQDDPTCLLPTSAALQSTAMVVCPGASALLTMELPTPSNCLTTIWESAPSPAGPWTAIAYDGLSTEVMVDTTTWYRCILGTASGSDTTITPPLMIAVDGSPCHCLPYSESRAKLSTHADITRIVLGDLLHETPCTQVHLPLPSLIGRYSNFTGIVQPPMLTPGQPTLFQVGLTACSDLPSTYAIAVFIDLDQNGVFEVPDERLITLSGISPGDIATSLLTLPEFTMPGITRMRIIAANLPAGEDIEPTGVYQHGETEDYCVEVSPAPICNAAPDPGNTVLLPLSPCGVTPATLSLSNSQSLPAGLTYMWQSGNSDTGPWTDTGDNGPWLTTELTGPVWFRCVVTCTATGESSPSVPVWVDFYDTPCQCNTYAASSAMFTSGSEIKRVSLGTMDQSSNCTTPWTENGSLPQRYSNYTLAVDAPALVIGQLTDLLLEVGSCAPMDTWSSIAVFVDLDQDGTFDQSNERLFQSGIHWGGYTLEAMLPIPPGSLPGTTRMRVVCMDNGGPFGIFPEVNYAEGETEDYCINLTYSTHLTSELSADAPDLVVWPNPNNGRQFNLRVQGLTTDTDQAVLELRGLTGGLLASWRVPVHGDRLEASFDLPGLAKGMYLVRLITHERQLVSKLVVH